MHRCRLILVLILSLTAPATWSYTLSIDVAGTDNKPVANAVVVFTPLRELTQAERQQASTAEPAVMNQINKQFVPHVLAVQTNTPVTFPNSDNIFHHVYSFSPAKQFELKLYKEFTAQPVRFSTPGIVDLGCNIHDWMLGFIYITDSPYFATTTAGGKASVTLPGGDYAITLWHPRMKAGDRSSPQALTVNEDEKVSLEFSLPLYPSMSSEIGFEEYE